MAAVRLDALGEEHLDATRRWMADEDLRWGLLLDREVTPELHRGWFSRTKEDTSQAIFAIVADGAHAGNFGFRHIHRQHRTAELWMYLGAEHRGSGIAKPALRAGLDCGFGSLALRKISLLVRADNHRAVSLYTGAGFVEEGFLRAEQIYRGTAIDMIRMAYFPASTLS